MVAKGEFLYALGALTPEPKSTASTITGIVAIVNSNIILCRTLGIFGGL